MLNFVMLHHLSDAFAKKNTPSDKAGFQCGLVCPLNIKHTTYKQEEFTKYYS